MARSNITAARIAEVCARLINNESQTSIRNRMKIGSPTIGRVLRTLRIHGITIETRRQMRPNAERMAEAIKLFRTTNLSNRAIKSKLGMKLDTVSKYRKYFNKAEIEAGRELPKCDCGQYLHHPRLCWVRIQASMKARGIRSFATLGTEQKADVRHKLMAGETLQAIAASAGIQKSSIQHYLKSFSAEDRQEREDCFLVAGGRRRAAEMTRKMPRPKATNPNADPLYAQIAKAVPRGIDPALRDDMISQAYLEVLEGKLDPRRLAEGVRKIRGRVFQAFANPWGAVSLDALASDGSGRSMIDSVPDGATAFV